MKNIVIIYYSGTGSTAKIAEAVGRGASSVADADVQIIAIEGKDITEGRYQNEDAFGKLAQADAIIFGSPTYMGGPAAQFKAFADASAGAWFGQAWKDKVAGGFTVSGNPSGDKLLTLEYLAVLAAQHGMHWVTVGQFPSHYLGKTDGVNRLGSSLGLMAQNTTPQGEPLAMHPGDILTAEAYGRRIMEVTAKLRA
jgi:NAD(P)H dehydrogenase (quinone)